MRAMFGNVEHRPGEKKSITMRYEIHDERGTSQLVEDSVDISVAVYDRSKCELSRRVYDVHCVASVLRARMGAGASCRAGRANPIPRGRRGAAFGRPCTACAPPSCPQRTTAA